VLLPSQASHQAEEADAWRAMSRRSPSAAGQGLQLRCLAPGRPLHPKELAYLLKTHRRIRAEDKDALVIAGGLTPADAPWLESLFAEDMAAYLDG